MCPTYNDIEKMNYNELISVVKETNRPPGGIRTILEALKFLNLDKDSKLLDIGTSTGFTAIEIARLKKCKVVGIDINNDSLEEARARAKKFGVKDVTFSLEDATVLSFPQESFDAVFCGNVTSLIPDRKKALLEYIRVTKQGGFIIATPMYYIKTPPDSLIDDVSKAIRTKVAVQDKAYWTSFYTDPALQSVASIDFKFDAISSTTVRDFVEGILSREHLRVLDKKSMKLLKEKYSAYMSLFAKNISYMGHSIMILRKKDKEIDPELFTSTPA